mmetsp:Transcript_26610/g.81780  ORF Transcript_26610/g.81780 Transcript_26610/m.81780 type:complete len:737 (+) Transcript_26610:79-2289(+)
MPASNRICCLLSVPLAAVGGSTAANRMPGVEGEMKALPLVDTESERLNLESALREGCAETGRAIELQIRYATLEALRSVVTLGARAIHFAGHGHPEFLCFEDGRGGAVAANNDLLRRLVSAGNTEGVRLVVVNSCHSQAAGQAFVEAGVPHVVAVSSYAGRSDGRVSDKAATAFCRAFYLGLIAGKTVRQSFDIGCAAASKGMTYVLLPENESHDERIFSDAPLCTHGEEKCLDVLLPSKTPTNAPASPTYYLGRDRDMFCLVDAMLRHRLTTVAGDFGCGKSSVAAAAAHYLADRGVHFDAVVWCKVQTRHSLVDDVVDATRCVLSSSSSSSSSGKNPQPPESWHSTLNHHKSSGSLVAAADGVDFFSQQPELPKEKSFSSLQHLSADADPQQQEAARLFLRERRVLIILDDFEKLLVVQHKFSLSVRAECQRALASLLSTAAKARVVLTCSRTAGLGRSTSVTEHVIKLTALEPRAAARLLLHRAPELARRATNAKAARGPKVPPDVLVAATAAHPVIRRLGGNPFAIALSATLLNSLFAQEDAAAVAAEDAKRDASSPKSRDRFLSFLLRHSNSSSALPPPDGTSPAVAAAAAAKKKSPRPNGIPLSPQSRQNASPQQQSTTTVVRDDETREEGEEDPVASLLAAPRYGNRSKSSPAEISAMDAARRHLYDADALEPLDRLLKLLDSTHEDCEDSDLRLRDEINFVTTKQQTNGSHQDYVDDSGGVAAAAAAA